MGNSFGRPAPKNSVCVLLGLTNHDPYRVDVVADGPRTMGGDGGCNICGGVGFFMGWLPLATAFRLDNGLGWSQPDANLADGYCLLRRVIPLS